MTQVFDCSDEQKQEEGLEAARTALADGSLVVLPTDTVYGLAADAFNADGVARIFEAKGRGREMPPPVLVPNPRTVDGLAMARPAYVRRLINEFWPGALTIVLRAQQSLSWDLGDTNGTVGLRMPDDELTLTLLAETGPLAVSSANRTGEAAATTVTEAGFMLGPYVDVYLDGGERSGGVASTIIDCTKPDPVVLREGAISVERLQEVLGDIEIVTHSSPEDYDATVEFDDPTEFDADDETGAELPDDAEVVSSADAEVGESASLGEHWEADVTPDHTPDPVGDELPHPHQQVVVPPDPDSDPTSNER